MSQEPIQFTPFDAAEFLDDEEVITEYLTAALEDPNPDVFLVAVRNVARARGMAHACPGHRAGAREPLQGANAQGPSLATTPS